MSKTILITGCSTGIGLETALYFIEKGWNVVATMRNPESRKTPLHEKGIDILHLDVLDIATVKKAIDFTKKKFGKIDVLVNNAGFAYRGVFETTTQEDVRKQFETNVVALMDVVREIIPVFREQKDGTIINVASIGGRASFPYYTLYNSSKWAVEGFSEALQYELKQFGIRIKIIEPGIIKTDFYNRSMADTGAQKATEYTESYNSVLAKNSANEKAGSHPRIIGKLIYKAANNKSGKMRFSAGSMAKTVLGLKKILPERLYMWLIRLFTM